MPDQKQVTETTEVTTETSSHTDAPVREGSSYRKETKVTTERMVEKDEEPIIIIKH